MNMHKRNWIGHWICARNIKSAPYLRRTFECDSAPEKARIFIAAPGWHELYINGKKADDRFLSPTVSQFDRRVLYVSYDIADQLTAGRNAVTVLLGNGLYFSDPATPWNYGHAPWRDVPKLLCDIEIDGKIIAGSDDSWKISESPLVFNHLRSGENYDARLEIPDVLENFFDDSSWKPANYCNPPGGIIVEDTAAPCRIIEAYEGRVRQLDGETWVYDFGRNLTGWCELEVEGPAGTEIELKYSEQVTEQGIITRDELAHNIRFQTDSFILNGKGKNHFRAHFAYHGFRYCQLCCWSPELRIHRIRAVLVASDFADAGSFHCSDQTVNYLQKITRHTYRCNFTGIPTDCPHREKNGWTGDAQLAIETGLWNFNVSASAAHFVRTLADAQRPDGQLPAVAPSSGYGYNWGSGPAWDICLFEIPWRIFLFTGDDSLIRELLPAMERYLDYCQGMARNHLVSFGLGDWCAFDAVHASPQELTSSAYYYHAAEIVSYFRPEYRQLASSVRSSINDKYYRGDGIYGSGELTSQACALYFKLVPEEDRVKTAAVLTENVRRKDHRADFGILGAKYILRVLCDCGYSEDAFRILVQEKLPGWGYWVSRGATTLWEHWGGRHSQNHIMFGDISAWMYEYLGGIRPLPQSPGFRHFEIRPCFVHALNQVECSYRSPFGKIQSQWQRIGNRIRAEFCIPAETTADICLPGKTLPQVTGQQKLEFISE